MSNLHVLSIQKLFFHVTGGAIQTEDTSELCRFSNGLKDFNVNMIRPDNDKSIIKVSGQVSYQSNMQYSPHPDYVNKNK